jgi:DNA segregation ATPase FtsK/SpoIIIE-like protein
MKILRVDVKNYRLIEAMMLDLNGDNLAVAGEPGQGKSTAISVLWEALKTVGDPISHGQKKGQIKITLGDGKTQVFVTRNFTKKTAQISILTSEGETITAKEFATWFCSMGQNPHKIMEMKPLERTNILLSAVALPDGIDLDQLDADKATAAGERLDLKRDGERASKEIGKEPERVERIEISDLIQKQTDITTENQDRVRETTQLDAAEKQLIILKESVKQKEKASRAAERLEKQAAIDAADQIELITQLKTSINALPPAIDAADIQRQIADAHAANKAADEYDTWDASNKALTKLRDDYKVKNSEISDLEAAKKEALENATWPLDGLSIEDSVIYFNGSPLDQCGSSEQMLVCGALAAETISKSKLLIARMDGIESMAAKDFKRLEKIFNDKGIQVLSSRVTRGDIEDGEILIVDGAIQEGE